MRRAVVDLVQEGELGRSHCAIEAGVAVGATVTTGVTRVSEGLGVTEGPGLVAEGLGVTEGPGLVAEGLGEIVAVAGAEAGSG